MADNETRPVEGTAAPKAPASKDSTSKDGAKGGNAKIWMGTAVGIGSAAIVAALLYAKKRS